MTDYDAHFIYPAGSDKYTATALPDRTPYNPRFQHHEFKHGVCGSLQFTNIFEGVSRDIFVQIFIHADKNNSTVIPSLDNVSIHPFIVTKYGKTPIYAQEQCQYDGCEWHKELQIQVLAVIESRVYNNQEMLNNLTEY